MLSPTPEQNTSDSAIFMVLRQMRLPLIVLILTFTFAIVGMMAMPGKDNLGNPWNMDVFEAFYFMSYTASTIGYGELPYPFSTPQSLWVILSIFVTVVAWTYAIGKLVSLLRDDAFRTAVSTQRFARAVERLQEPFVLVVGFGDSGRRLGRLLDANGQQFVVLDKDTQRITQLPLESLSRYVPAHPADGVDPKELIRAGLGLKHCTAVAALTDDEEANLAVVMTASLLAPNVPVVARATEPIMMKRMAAFGDPMIVDPFDLFGDELVVELQKPQTLQLLRWLVSEPGSECPAAERTLEPGKWIIAGEGHFAHRLADDLTKSGNIVTIIDPEVSTESFGATMRRLLPSSAGFAAATDNDTTNLSLLMAAKRLSPEMYLVARQNEPVNQPLFDALNPDSVLVPTWLIAREAIARIGTPLLWRFIEEAKKKTNEWSDNLLTEISRVDHESRPRLWGQSIDPSLFPPLQSWLADGDSRLGELLRDPDRRDISTDLLALMVLRGDDAHVLPSHDFRIEAGDEMLLAGNRAAHESLEDIFTVRAAFDYAVKGNRSKWAWSPIP